MTEADTIALSFLDVSNKNSPFSRNEYPGSGRISHPGSKLSEEYPEEFIIIHVNWKATKQPETKYQTRLNS